MDKNSTMIPIDENAMMKTIDLCIQQQDINQHHSASVVSLMLRFLCIDFRFFMMVSTLSFIIMMFFICIVRMNEEVCILLYFFLLGLSSIYEVYKSKVYCTCELFTPVYLNPARALLIKHSGIAFIEFILAILLLNYLYFFHPTQLFIISFGCMLPFYLLQILCSYALPFIKGYMTAFTLYALLYAAYMSFYAFELRIPISIQGCITFSVVLLFLYAFHLWRFYRNIQKQGDKKIWNFS